MTAKSSHAFIDGVWDRHRLGRGSPRPATLKAWRKKLKCAAGPGHRKAMKHRWRKAKASYYKRRSAMLWVLRVKPFVYPDGTRWSAPYPIAICESGENYYVGPSGAYGLIPPFPQYLPPKQQDEIAHRLYLEMGEGPWAPYESGCYLR